MAEQVEIGPGGRAFEDMPLNGAVKIGLVFNGCLRAVAAQPIEKTVDVTLGLRAESASSYAMRPFFCPNFPAALGDPSRELFDCENLEPAFPEIGINYVITVT